MELYPEDYTPVRAGGPKGDMKNDGYCPKARIFFAAHATRGEKISKTKSKIREDLEGCIRNHSDVKKWIYVTNDVLLGEVQSYVGELRDKYPGVEIETWGPKKLAKKVSGIREDVAWEVIGISLPARGDADAEIDNAAEYIKQGEPRIALVFLQRMRSRNWNRLSDRQRYRVLANTGHACLSLEEYKKAAGFFVEAVQHQPNDEKARCFQILGLMNLGNQEKAETVADELRKDFPESAFAAAMWVNSRPRRSSFEEIEKGIPVHLRADGEVAVALAGRALMQDRYNDAERYAEKALQMAPDNYLCMEKLGNALIQRELHRVSQLVGARQLSDRLKDRLNRAVDLFSKAFDILQRRAVTKGMVRLRLKRAETYTLLGRAEDADSDLIEAHRMDSEAPETIIKNACVLSSRGKDIQEAVRSLEELVRRKHPNETELVLGSLLWQRNGEGDRVRAVKLLVDKLLSLGYANLALNSNYVELIAEYELKQGAFAEVLRMLDDVDGISLTNETRFSLQARVRQREGDLNSAMKAARKAGDAVNEQTSFNDKRRVAVALSVAGEHERGFALWKQIVKTDFVGSDTYSLLECARVIQEDEFVLEFCEALRAGGIWDESCLRLEMIERGMYNDTDSAIETMQDYLENPDDESLAKAVRVWLSLVGIFRGKIDLVEKDLDKMPSAKEVKDPFLGRQVVNVLRYAEDPLVAVRYAYGLFRKYPDDFNSFMAMWESFRIVTGKEPEVEEPKVVRPGSAVCYQEDCDDKKQWWVIEDEENPSGTRRELSPDHVLARRMMGKRQGDKFSIREDEIAPREATILEIKSKFVYRSLDCMETHEEKFPEKAALRKYSAVNEAGEIDLNLLYRSVDERVKYVNETMRIWQENHLPLFYVTKRLGSSQFETIARLHTEPDWNIACCFGDDKEWNRASNCLARAKGLILDISAIATLFSSQMYDQLPCLGACRRTPSSTT